LFFTAEAQRAAEGRREGREDEVEPQSAQSAQRRDEKRREEWWRRVDRKGTAVIGLQYRWVAG